jgi:uncharacterized membrane protein YccC
MRFLVLTVVLLAFGAAAWAAGQGDRAMAEGILAEVERDPAAKTTASDAIAKAKSALERGTRLRAAGDEAHARVADELAREWAETARDVAKASEIEKKAAEARAAATDAGAQVERERALLEEAIARAGRLRAQLEAAEREAKDTNRTATAALDGGAPKPKAPPRTPPKPQDPGGQR